MGKVLPRMPVLAAALLLPAALWPDFRPSAAAAAENPKSAADAQAERHAEIQLRLRQLDSPCYETRVEAAQRIEHWLALPEMAGMLADEFQRLSVQPDLSFEVRWRIVRWRAQLPRPKSEPPQSASTEELQRLVRQLDDDSYSVRDGACERLRWMASSEALARPIMLLLKRRLADPSLSDETYHRMESIREVAWGVWLSSDAPDWNLPPVTDGQIDGWLNELGQPVEKPDLRAAVRRRIARDQLLDVLSQDRQAARVKASIEALLRAKPDHQASGDLKEILRLTRPVIVAERWSGGRQVLEQHLVVGEPSYNPAPARPSFFDRADEHVGHCASGNALNPGDYPVGVAFLPPNRPSSIPDAVFDLVYLPTPRRQIAYSYYVKTDPAARLARLSRRTLDRFLAEKSLLDDPQLGVLVQLDAREVSRFASRFFLAMDDGEIAEDIEQNGLTGTSHFGGQTSCFGAIGAQLAVDGRQEAAPGLLEAIRRKKFHLPTSLGGYRVQWLAALAIAARDPWPGVDAWLAENLDNRQTLVIDHDEWGHRRRRRVITEGDDSRVVIESKEPAEIGATAAGLLLARHQGKPQAFGLQPAVDSDLHRLKLPGFRYHAADDIQRIRDWWKRQSPPAPKAPHASFFIRPRPTARSA